MQPNATTSPNNDVGQHPSCLQNLQNYFAEFCANTSIHGVKFLGERRRSICERIWWLIFLGVSLYFCTGSILEAYHKWELSPVVVSFATSETAVWKIPFPAVTICPQMKIQKSLVNFTKLVLKKRNEEKLSPEETKQLEYASMICSTKWRLFVHENVTKVVDGDDLTDFLYKVQPQFYHTINECSWSGKDCSKNIEKMFIPILTKEGFCYSFNQLDRDEIFTKDADNSYYQKYFVPHQAPSKWSLEKGFEKGSTLDLYPRRSVSGGTYAGLDLTFYLNSSDLDHLCGDALQGFKVTLHNPIQLPLVKQKYFRVGLNQDVTAAVKPTIMTTSKQLRQYSPKQRKCFFGEEKKLRFFKAYDQYNCLHECLCNFTQRHCGCVAFSMLHDRSTPVCGIGKQECIKQSAATFLATRDYKQDCNCLPSCNALTFEAEISQTEWNWREGVKMLSANGHGLPGFIHYSRLQLFFRDMQFITSERNELYGQMDFLASCGGLLGLFIGFSVLSIVEILYYVTLRLFCNMWKYGRHRWSGETTPIMNGKK